MQRHPGDVLRVLAGGLVVAAGGMAARHGHVFTLDANLFRLVNQLRGALGRPLLAVMQVGALAAVPVVAAVALIARRPRLARDLALSGGLAWVLAKLVKDLVGEARPVALLHGVVQRTVDTGFGYPSGHVAVAAAQHDHDSPPEVVAEAVVHALTTPQPRAHYLVGKNSRRMAVLAAALPTPVLDRLRRRQAHQPAPGSRVSAAAGAQAAVGGRSGNADLGQEAVG
jgi:hypothetical protein